MYFKILSLPFDSFISLSRMIFVGSIFSRLEIKVVFALAAYFFLVSQREQR